MLLSGHKLELTCGNTSLKPGANFRVRCFTHTASQSIAVKLAFVGDGLALKAAVAGIGDSLPCHLLRTLPVMFGRIFLTTPLCFDHNFVGLVAELGGDLPMSGQYLGGRVNLLAVTGGVRGDLRGLRPLIAGLFQMLAYLLAARAGGVKVLL